MDIEKVKKLTEIFYAKRLVFETMGIRGQSHDLDERKEQTVEYEVARAKMMEARRNLDNEQGL